MNAVNAAAWYRVSAGPQGPATDSRKSGSWPRIAGTRSPGPAVCDSAWHVTGDGGCTATPGKMLADARGSRPRRRPRTPGGDTCTVRARRAGTCVHDR
jgi:hypothetical protein